MFGNKAADGAAEKRRRRVEQAEGDLRRAEAARVGHAKNRPDGLDLDLLIAWRQADKDHVDRIEAAEEIVANTRRVADEEAEAEARALLEREYEAAEKLVISHRRLTQDISDDAERLAAKLAELEEMRATIEAASKAAAHLPSLVDGEKQLREVPGYTEPAQYQESLQWRDNEGNAPIVRTGGVPFVAPHDRFRFRQVPVRELVRPERHVPCRMPERFATSIRLVDLAGTQIWPPHDRAAAGVMRERVYE